MSFQEHFRAIKDATKHLFAKEVLSDVQFLVKNKNDELTKIFAHKLILAIRSPVFYSMFEHSNENVIEIHDLESAGFIELIRYIYYDEIKCDLNNLMHIYQAADKYCVTSLREKLLKAINSKLNSKNVLYFYESLIAFPTTKDEDLFEIYRIMDNHTKDVFETEIFKLINKDTLALILKRDNLTIREMDVYRACLAWTDHKLSKKKIEVTPNARRKSLGDMIYLIRFPLMSSTEFSSGPAKDKVLNGDEISEIYLYLNEPNYKGEFIQKFNSRPRKSTRDKSTNSVQLFKLFKRRNSVLR